MSKHDHRDSQDSTGAGEDAVARLTEDIASLAASGGTIDYESLAKRHGVSVDDVRRCQVGVEALVAPPSAGDEAFADDVDLPSPSLPDDYELLEEIGRGGMGVVYRARQKSLDRVVAVKVLQPGELVFGQALRRFQLEAKSLAKLRHRHIVSVHEVGEHGGNVFYTMDLIDGRSLAEVISSGEVTPARAVRILRQVTSAVAYTHSHGIIHRDLKPHNILIDEAGDAYVVDFGLAREVSVPEGLTATGHVLGTPNYMSPEQARGHSEEVGEATDVYALGAVLYECLCGARPFQGLPLAELIHSVIHVEPRKPSRVGQGVPEDLEVICLKALEKDPARRFPTARAMLEDLERFEQGRPIRARPRSIAYVAARFLVRNRAMVAAAVLGAVVVSIAVALSGVDPESPEGRVEFAEQCHAEGAHDLAIEVLVNVRGTKWPSRARESWNTWGHYRLPSKYDPLARRLQRQLSRCRKERADALRADGRLDDAARLYRVAIGESEPFWDRDDALKREFPGFADAIWQLALCEVRLGRVKEAHVAVGRYLRHGERPGSDFLRELRAELLDPDHPVHDAAIDLVIEQIQWAKTPAVFGDGFEKLFAMVAVRFLERCEKKSAEECRDLLRSGVDDLATQAKSVMDDERWGRKLLDRLAESATDKSLPVAARAVVAHCLSRAADLPFDLDPREILAATPQGVAAILNMWRDERRRSGDKLERHHRTVELAIDAFPHHPGLTTWLERQTGYHPGGVSHLRRTDAMATKWRAWWDAHVDEDPRQWLHRALSLPGSFTELTAAELRQRFHAELDRKRRNLFTTLFELSFDGRIDSTEAVPGEATTEHVLRVAWFEERFDQDDPVLVHEQVRTIQLGKKVAIRGPEPRDSPGPAFWVSERFDGPYGSYRRRRSRLAPKHDEIGARLIHLPGELGLLTSPGRRVPLGTVALAHEPRQLHDRLVLAVAQRDDERRPWSAADWKRKIVENLEDLATGLSQTSDRNGAAFRDRLRSSRRGLQLLAAYWPVPEARGSLAVLSRMGQRESWEDSALGRLMAGDSAVLDEEEFPRKLPSGPGLRDSEPFYWLRLRSVTDDSRIRELANSRVTAHMRLVRDYEAEELCASLVESGGKPDPILEAEVSRTQWVKIRRYWSSLLLVGVLWILAPVALAALLIRRRRAESDVRLFPAWFLLLGGSLAVLLDVHISNWNVLPDLVGFALLVVGSVPLAAAVTIRTRWVAPVAFLAAILLDAGTRLEIVSHAMAIATSAAFFVGLVWLALIAHELVLGARLGQTDTPSAELDKRQRTERRASLLLLIPASLLLALVNPFLAIVWWLLRPKLPDRADVPPPSMRGFLRVPLIGVVVITVLAGGMEVVEHGPIDALDWEGSCFFLLVVACLASLRITWSSIRYRSILLRRCCMIPQDVTPLPNARSVVDGF